MSKTAIVAVIPTRGDRPHFMEQAYRLIEAQTWPLDGVITVDYPPTSPACDGVERTLDGVNLAASAGATHIFLWEDDNYYAPNYIETMMRAWPTGAELIGQASSIYYHLGLRQWEQYLHPQKGISYGCAFTPSYLAGRTVADFPGDKMPELWRPELTHGRTVAVLDLPLRITVGMKHADGSCVASAHTAASVKQLQHDDHDFKWLGWFVEAQFVEFYKQFNRQAQKAA